MRLPVPSLIEDSLREMRGLTLDTLVEWVVEIGPQDIASIRGVVLGVSAECEYVLGKLPRDAVPLSDEDRAALRARAVPLTPAQLLFLSTYRASCAQEVSLRVARELKGV